MRKRILVLFMAILLLAVSAACTPAQDDVYETYYDYMYIDPETGEFVENFYYIYDGSEYTLATIYDASATYFIRTTKTSSYVSIWKDYLAVYITVADGEKVPYQVFSLEDLEEISQSYDSVTKRYVMVRI